MRGLTNVLPGRPEGLRYTCLLVAALLIPAPGRAQTRRAITIDDLLAFHRISEPRISPDGASVVYTVATPDRAGNKSVRNIWIVPTANVGPLFVVSAEGGRPKVVTPGPDYALPPRRGKGPPPIGFPPEGKETESPAVVDPMKAASTNGDIFPFPAEGTPPPKKITTGP